MGGFSASFGASLEAGISAGVSLNVGAPNTPPFTAFNFVVEIRVEGVSDLVCGGAFSECDGIEMSIEPKTIKEGGKNSGPVHLVGPVSYGQLTLKRGMTSSFDLWKWFEKVASRDGGGLRATAELTMFAADGRTEQAHFTLSGCLPVKLRAASLNAKDGQLAIEEMQIAYESLSLEQATAGGGIGLSVGLSAGGSVGISASAGSIDASASLDASISASTSGSIGF